MTEHLGGRPEPAPDTPSRTSTESAAEAPPPRKPDTTSTSSTSATSGTSGTSDRIKTRTRIGGTRTRGTRSGPAMSGWRRIRDAIATAVLIAAVTVAIILAVHIVFVVFEANGANGIVKTINSWADSLAWNFRDIFTPANPKTAAFVNYGLAAGVYLIAGRVVAGLIHRAG